MIDHMMSRWTIPNKSGLFKNTKVDIAISIHFWWLNCFKLFIANTTFRGTILKYNGCFPDKEKIHTFYLQQVYRGSKFGLQCQIIIKDRLDKDQYEYSTS